MAFTTEDRALLLSRPQIGPVLLQRLEAAGFDSLAQMRQAGAAAVMAAVCRQSGQRALANRVRALQRALDAGAPGGPGAGRPAGSTGRLGGGSGWRNATVDRL